MTTTKLKNKIKTLEAENLILQKKVAQLDELKNELERKNLELEATKKEQKKQQIQIIRKSLDLSDVKRKLEDKNYDLKQLQITLEDLVVGRTIELKNANIKLREEINEKNIFQKALEESERLYRVIFDNSGTSIIIIDDDMKISMANAKAVELCGFTQKELMEGVKWTDLVGDKDDLNKMLCYHRRRREGDPTIPNEYEFKVRHKDGSLRDALINIDIIPGTSRALASLIDVTERNKTERTKISLEKRLLQSQKMEAIGTLAGGIAHDFNNILSAVMGYTELSIGICKDNHKLSRWLNNALNACLRAKDLVQQILTFSRQNEHELKPIRLSAITKEVLKFLTASFPSNIILNFEEFTEHTIIIGDPTQIHQVIMNLCTNAYQAMEETGGEIKITIEQIKIDSSEEKHDGLSDGEYLLLSVKDSGTGIDEAIRDRIFDPFFTTKGQGKGTGMGLSTVHGIMEEIGGAVSLDSKVGKGSTFYLYFPRVDADEEAVADTSMNLPHGNETIMLVDDDKSVLEMTKEMLITLGYNIIAINDSTLVESVFNKNPQMFDLILTDHMMPGVTGNILAKKILEIRPELPIILYTGFSGVFTAEDAESSGIKQFLIKPVSRRTLAESIRQCLDEK